MTEIGTLNRRVTFKRRQAGTDSAGDPLDTWVEVFTRWASIAGKSGLKTITGNTDGVSSSITQYSIRVRFTTAITVDMRAECDGVVYRILSIQQDNVERLWTDVVCQVGAPGD